MRKTPQIQAIFKKFKNLEVPCFVVPFAKTKLLKVKFDDFNFFLEFEEIWSRRYGFLFQNVEIITSTMGDEIHKFRMWLLKNGFFE